MSNFRILGNVNLFSSSCLCPVGCLSFAHWKKKYYVIFENSTIRHISNSFSYEKPGTLKKTQGLFFHKYFKHMRGKTDLFYITLEKVHTWVGRRINKHHHNFCVFVIAQSHQTFVWACFLKCENNTIELPISSVSLTIEN